MNVGMDEVERLLKRAVSTGAAVVVVILGPGQGAAPPSDRPATSGAVTATVTPVPTPDQASIPEAMAVTSSFRRAATLLVRIGSNAVDWRD